MGYAPESHSPRQQTLTPPIISSQSLFASPDYYREVYAYAVSRLKWDVSYCYSFCADYHLTVGFWYLDGTSFGH